MPNVIIPNEQLKIAEKPNLSMQENYDPNADGETLQLVPKE